jgi:hypothetical protein
VTDQRPPGQAQTLVPVDARPDTDRLPSGGRSSDTEHSSSRHSGSATPCQRSSRRPRLRRREASRSPIPARLFAAAGSATWALLFAWRAAVSRCRALALCGAAPREHHRRSGGR